MNISIFIFIIEILNEYPQLWIFNSIIFKFQFFRSNSCNFKFIYRNTVYLSSTALYCAWTTQAWHLHRTQKVNSAWVITPFTTSSTRGRGRWTFSDRHRLLHLIVLVNTIEIEDLELIQCLKGQILTEKLNRLPFGSIKQCHNLLLYNKTDSNLK